MDSLYLIPGFKFKPTDEELLLMLEGELNGKPLCSNIKTIRLYDIHADLLSDCYKASEENGNWFLFTKRTPMSENATRPSRCTPGGFWRATTTSQPIKSRESKREIGKKNTLVYFKGNSMESTKTNFIMHEYILTTTTSKFDEWVVCRIHHNNHNSSKTSMRLEVNDNEALPYTNETMLINHQESTSFTELDKMIDEPALIMEKETIDGDMSKEEAKEKEEAEANDADTWMDMEPDLWEELDEFLNQV